MPIDMMPIKISSAETSAQIIEVADLANTIWTEHFTPLIGSAQVYYMLEKFQSVVANQSDPRRVPVFSDKAGR